VQKIKDFTPIAELKAKLTNEKGKDIYPKHG